MELILEIWERYGSASEVTILWRYTNLFIIIIIMKAHCTVVDTNFQILWPINNVDRQYDHNPYLHPFQQIQVQVTFLSLLKIRDIGTTRHATLPAGWITQNFLKTNQNAYTHNRLTALFPGLQWVAVASAGPYASLHLAPDR